MGSDHTRGRRLAGRCCQGACFGVGFFSTAFAVVVMFWILWCYLGLSVVQVSDSQRRGSPIYTNVPTTRRPLNRTEVPPVEGSVNAIYKTATTLASSNSAATEVSVLQPPKNPISQGTTTQAKGDFADRSRGDATNPATDVARGSKPKDIPVVNLTSGTLYEGVEDGIHPRRVPPGAKENQYEGGGSEKDKLPRVDISPTQAVTDNRPKSSYPDLNERKTSSRDYPISSSSRSDEIQSSRRSDTNYRVPDFERDNPRSPPRRYIDDDDYDSRRYRDRYDDRDRDRGRDSADKLSKGDTRVYPDYERDPDRRPVDDDDDDDDERYDQGRRGDYPRSSSRRSDDDYDSRTYRDRTIDRDRSRDSEDKLSKDDTRRVYPEYERDTYSDRRYVDDERYDQRRRGDDDRYRYRDDRYDYPRGSSRGSEERIRERDDVRRRDSEGRYRDAYDDVDYRREDRYREGPRYDYRSSDRFEGYPASDDRKPVRPDEERIRDTYVRDRPPVNSRSSPSSSRKDSYDDDDDYRRPPSRSDERDRIVPTRVISISESPNDRTKDRYSNDKDRQDDDRIYRTRLSDERKEDRPRLSDDRREDRTRMSDDRREDRTRMSEDRDYRPRPSDDRRSYRTRLADDTEYRTRLPDERIDDRDDVVLETRSYPSRERGTQDSRTKVRSDVDDRDLPRISDREYDRWSDREYRNSRPRGDFESSRSRFEDDDRPLPRKYAEDSRKYDRPETVSSRREYTRDSYPADDERDRRYRPGYIDDRSSRDRPEYRDERDRRYSPEDTDDRIRPYDREDRPLKDDDRRISSRYPDDRRQSPRREPPTGSSSAEEVDFREKRLQNADRRNVDSERPLRPQDVIEAAQKQPDTSDTSPRQVSYPVFNPKGSNLTSPEIIRSIERRGTTLTSRRKRRALTRDF